MYSVDHRDEVVPLSAAPQSSVGAPLPIVLADEHTVLLAYYVEERDPAWDGTTVRVVRPTTAGEPLALVQFQRPHAHWFGPPNDEAFEGHPLAARGLHPYGVFEIRASSWVRALERMNRVHQHHDPQRFAELRHYVFAFHDSTFECVAGGFVVHEQRSSLAAVLPEMQRRLQRQGASI